MIHDATGKFSSRWVFPDRSSLALVIKRTGYIHQDWRHAPHLAHAMGSRPHIGEYAAKTNAIWAHWPIPHAPPITPVGPGAKVNSCNSGLLTVVFQDLVAGSRDLGTMLLKARQDGEV